MEYILHILIFTAIYSIAGLGLNLLSGFTGLVSVAQGAFMGIGAYTVAILMTTLQLNFFIALLIGVIITSLVAFMLGYVFSKLNGDYFVLGTIGFASLIYSMAQNLSSITRGPLGIPGIPSPTIFGINFGSNFSFFILALTMLAVCYGILHFITSNSFGRVLKAIREDEKALQIFGYKTSHYKLIAFVLAGALGAMSGGLLASYLTFIDPASFNLTLSVFILTGIILGGLASLPGTVAGVLILVLVPEALRFVGFSSEIAGQMREMTYGLILILFMMYRPKGIWGKYKI